MPKRPDVLALKFCIDEESFGEKVMRTLISADGEL